MNVIYLVLFFFSFWPPKPAYDSRTEPLTLHHLIPEPLMGLNNEHIMGLTNNDCPIRGSVIRGLVTLEFQFNYGFSPGKGWE
jgi:hypothetical protein